MYCGASQFAYSVVSLKGEPNRTGACLNHTGMKHTWKYYKQTNPCLEACMAQWVGLTG